MQIRYLYNISKNINISYVQTLFLYNYLLNKTETQVRNMKKEIQDT